MAERRASIKRPGNPANEKYSGPLDSPCPPDYASIDDMRHPSTRPSPAPEGELIAGFGECRPLKSPNGSFEFSGGTAEDRAKAAEWAGMFLRREFPEIRIARFPVLFALLCC